MSRSSGSSNYDRHITIFSPEGRLYQVEYAFKAVKGAGLSCVAVKGVDCAVVAAQKKVPDRLLDPKSVTSLYQIIPTIGCAMIGLEPDCRAIVRRARQIASEFEYEYGYPIPVHYLTVKVANIAQVHTQHAHMRLHAFTGLFISVDDEKGPAVYKIDPAGHVFGCKAGAAGAKEAEATNGLEKMVKKCPSGQQKEVVQLAIECLQLVLSADLKCSDVEVAIVTKADNNFRLLLEEEVEEHLNAIAEKD
eukprot:Filipodium_phascolosomae@DN1636_c0_g1_i1.p1